MNKLLTAIQERKEEQYKYWLRYNHMIDVCTALNITVPDNVSMDIMSNHSIDFNNCTREQFNIIRSQFPKGTQWRRAISSGSTTLDYTAVIDGITFRFWQTPPPPSCAVVYEDKFIPAHTERRAKVVCGDHSTDASDE